MNQHRVLAAATSGMLDMCLLVACSRASEGLFICSHTLGHGVAIAASQTALRISK